MALPLRILPESFVVDPLGNELASVESVTNYLDTHTVRLHRPTGYIYVNVVFPNTHFSPKNEAIAWKHFATANNVRSLGKIKAFLADYYDWLLSDDVDLRDDWEEQVWSPLGSKDEFIAQVVQLNQFYFHAIERTPDHEGHELVLRVDLREGPPGPALSQQSLARPTQRNAGTFRDLASDKHTAEPEYPCDNFEEGDTLYSNKGWDSKHIADSGGYIILPGTRPQDPKHCVSVEYMRNACESRQLDIGDQMGEDAGTWLESIDSCFNPFTNAKFTPVGSTLIRGILSGAVAPTRPRTHNKPDVWDIEKILTPGQLFYQ